MDEKEILEVVGAAKTSESESDIRTISASELTLGAGIPNQHRIEYSRPNKHQKKIGICTAAAVADAVEELYYQWAVAKGQVDKDWVGSMGWLYKIGKLFIDGNTLEGSSIFTMLKAAQKYGIPTEAKFPTDYGQTYAEFMADTEITQDILDDAGRHRLPGYASVPLDQNALLRAIYSSKVGILARMKVGRNWYTDKAGKITWERKKLEPLRPLESFDSGHAVKFTAYDATGDVKLTCRNSWGEQYCNKGDIDLFLKDHANDITEAWTIVDKQLFVKDLRIGDTHPEVKRLQQLLNEQGFIVAPAGAGSPGQETEYFGILTMKAVRAFQRAHGLPDTGFFGPLTRAAANKLT